MALDGTYAGLQASVGDFLNRADLAAVIPDFIRLAEAQLNRRLRVRRMVVEATASISGEYEAVPRDFAGARSLAFTDNRDLDFVTPEALIRLKSNGGLGPGEPCIYALVGGQFRFYPVPDAPYQALLTYYQQVPSLAVALSNWLLTTAPDVYLYGTLTQAAPYLIDDGRVATWGQLYSAGLADLEAQDRRESFSGRLNPIPAQVA